MTDGMKNLDAYLTQSDDVLGDPRITDDWIQADALGDLDLDEGVWIHVGHPDFPEVEGCIDSVSLSEDAGHWIVRLRELAYPVLIPNNTDRIDRA